jgi:hypothetical protein
MFDKLRNSPYFSPFMWSFGLHALVLLLFSLLFLDGFRFKEEPVASHVFHMKGVSTEPVKAGYKQPVKTNRFPTTKQFINAQMPGEPAVRDIPMQSLINKETVQAESSDDVDPKKVDLEGSGSMSTRDFQTILTRSDQRQLGEKIQSTQRSTAGSPNQKVLAKDKKLDAGSLMQFLQKPLQGLTIDGNDNVNLDPEEGMPGFTPRSKGHGRGGDSDYELSGRVGEPKRSASKYESIDAFLDIDVATYVDPSDKAKYYRIKIFAKKDAKLRVMPKEIIFTIDCSLSISSDRLEEFKKGIRYCLTNLNPGDVFNIVAFRETPIYFAPQSVAATPSTIDAAEKFVSGLTSNNRTDVYEVFTSLVKAPLARKPSNIILISDGRPTHGVVDSRELLTSITQLNAKARPIFAFSGGSRVNRYLLDFIAYQNRAWSQYIKKSTNIDKGLAEFYEKIRDPIFLNLRYRLSGLSEAETFPKSLPDFYRDAEFTLYGKFEGEDQFSMQLLGDIDAETQELVFSRALSESKDGGPDVMKGYAFNKIYHLISRVSAKGADTELIAEINRLSKKYGVLTPYSPELEKMD